MKPLMGIAVVLVVLFSLLHASAAEDAKEKYTNRLIHEKSPYLLQHAHNPVDWYPWGKEAFEKAKKENKPIFLSIGYSTCHWCHVMERESYENLKIAKILNDNFVSIKVDREERPDIDQVYMTFVQATTGSGGWPLNVWLTPELKPFAGGTYFPPTDRDGLPGLTTVLTKVARAWKTDREKIVASSDKILSALWNATEQTTAGSGKLPSGLREKAYQQFAARFDEKLGGFGEAPKFPRPVIFNFLYRVYAGDPDSKEGRHALEMTLFTLRKMAEGGIHDHIGGGFHRYSTDKYWHVPHFEKMLYDQAQLAVAYLDAFQITHEPLFERTARDVLDYVRRDMTGNEGGFYSAEDADSQAPVAAVYDRRQPEGGPPERGAHRAPLQKAEGAFYVWTKQEIDRVLGAEQAKVFDHQFGIQPDGNAEEDPQGEFKNKNILIQRHAVAETAEKFGLTKDKTEQLLETSRKLLFDARAQRPRPSLDDKIVTAWNGLMISAFARAYDVLHDPAYLEAANKSADFLRAKLYHPETSTLSRSYRAGASAANGFASDYAFLIQGLFDLYEASFDVHHLEWATQLQKRQDELFWDEKQAGYFTTSGKELLPRMKEDDDGAEPSPNSVSALNLLRLATMFDQAEARSRAEKLLQSYGRQLEQQPAALPQMLAALDWYCAKPKQIVIAGTAENPGAEAMLREVRSHFIPNKILILADGAAGQKFFAQRVEFMQSVTPIDDKATAYICQNFVCQLPTTDLKMVANLLAPGKASDKN